MPMLDIQPDKGNFARAGKIRLGIKVPNKDGNGTHPQETKYFVLKDVPEVAEHFRSTTGNDQPTELPIFFPFNEIEQCLIGWHKLHLSSSVYCKGDGQTVDYAVDKETGQRVIDKGKVIRKTTFDTAEFKPGDTVHCPGYNKVDAWKRCHFCRPNTIINFMIRGMPVEKLEMATYHIETPSVNNYPRLYEQLLGILEIVRDLTGEAYLAGVPIILKRVKASMGSPNLNKDGSRKVYQGKQQPARMRTEHYLLDLTIESWWIQNMMRQRMERQAQLMSSEFYLPETTEQIDDSDNPPDVEDGIFVNEDFQCFMDRVIKEIAWYQTDRMITEAMAQLDDIVYDPENEDFIFDQLARYAQNQADLDTARQEADSILGDKS